MIDTDIKYEFIDFGERIKITKSILKNEDENFRGIGYIKDIKNGILYVTNQNVNMKIIRGLINENNIYINKDVNVDILLPSDIEIEEMNDIKNINESYYYILYTIDRNWNKNIVVDTYYGNSKIEEVFPCKKCTKEFYDSINKILEENAFIQINDDATEFKKTYCTLLVENNKIIDCKKTEDELILDDNVWLVSFHLWGYLNNLNNNYDIVMFDVEGIDRSNNTNIYISDKVFCQKNFYTIDIPRLFDDYNDYIQVEGIVKKYTEKNTLSRYCWKYDKKFIDIIEKCKSDNIIVTLKNTCLSIQLTTNGLYIIPKYNLYDFVYVGGILCDIEGDIAIYDSSTKYLKNKTFMKFKTYDDLVNFYDNNFSSTIKFKVVEKDIISYEKADSNYFIDTILKNGRLYVNNVFSLSELSVPINTAVRVSKELYDFIKERHEDETVDTIIIPDINNINIHNLIINYKSIDTKRKEFLIKKLKNKFNTKYLHVQNLFLLNLLNLNLFLIKDDQIDIDMNEMIIKSNQDSDTINIINKILNTMNQDYKIFISYLNFMYEIDQLNEIDESTYENYILKIEEL